MKIKKIKVRIIMFSMLFLSDYSFLNADELKRVENPILGNLPLIYHKHIQELNELYKKYRRYKKDGNDVEKEKTKKKRNILKDNFNKSIEEFNQTHPLKGKELAFKVVSKNLPFDVQSVKVDKATPSALYFIIRVKMKLDVKRPNGDLSQRLSIYFGAVDLKNKIIPHTWNWATNDGWIKLNKDAIYDAQGHWCAERVQNMNYFSFIKIMSKADYKKLKETQ